MINNFSLKINPLVPKNKNSKINEEVNEEKNVEGEKKRDIDRETFNRIIPITECLRDFKGEERKERYNDAKLKRKGEGTFYICIWYVRGCCDNIV